MFQYKKYLPRNVSIRGRCFGAGDRTRTGTLSPAVDFESTTSTIPSHRQVCYTFISIDRCRRFHKEAALGGKMSPSFAVPDECPRVSKAFVLRRPLHLLRLRFIRYRRRSGSHRRMLSLLRLPFHHTSMELI